MWSTSSSEFTNRFRDQILSFDCMYNISAKIYIHTDLADEKMKQFDINMSKGAISNVDIIPPPSYSHGDIPFNYLYVASLPSYPITSTNSKKLPPKPNCQTISRSNRQTNNNQYLLRHKNCNPPRPLRHPNSPPRPPPPLPSNLNPRASSSRNHFRARIPL